jgi:acyl dehydratase
MAAPIVLADGTTWRLGRIEMEAGAVSAFAAAYDPQLQHLDEDAARHTLLQGQAASGWHTCALVIQQLKCHLQQRSLHVEVPTIEEIRWFRPVRPDDVLEATVRLRSHCRMPGCGRRGGWMVAIDAVNQAGEPVLRLMANALFADHRSPPDLVRARARACARRSKRSPRAVRRTGGHLVRYFEDVELGDEIALGSFDFSEVAVSTFANVIASPPPAVPSSGSPDESVPRVDGWHVVSAWMRLIVDYYNGECAWLAQQKLPAPLLGPAAGARCLAWCGSVHQGERITFTSWAEHKVSFGTSSAWGLLVAGAEGVNQAGETVLSFYPQFLLQKRPS